MWSLYWPQLNNNTASPFLLSLSPCLSIFSAKLKEQFSRFVRFEHNNNNKTMGENLGRNFPFLAPSSDPQACSSELTRTNSAFSGVTVENFRDPTARARSGQTMVWTNEKHNSYLDFLEASFVKQLHCSMSLHGRDPQEEMWERCLTQELQAKGHNSPHQFSVGYCQKRKYRSNDPLLDSTADSCDILGSPWLHHFASAGESSSETFHISSETVVPNNEIYLRNNTNFSRKSARNLEQHPIFHSCNHCLEVSDENFTEEDQGEKTSCLSGAKRLKMIAMLDTSSNSQVVPLGKLCTLDDSNHE